MDALQNGLPLEIFLLEGNMSATDLPPELDVQIQGKIKLFVRHPKDSIPLWISLKNLAKKSYKLVEGIVQHLWQPPLTLPPLQQLVDLHDDLEGIVLVELFARLGIGLNAFKRQDCPYKVICMWTTTL